MVWGPDLRVYSLGSHNFGTVHDKTKFSGFLYLDGYTDSTKFQQNPLELLGMVSWFHMDWPIGKMCLSF